MAWQLVYTSSPALLDAGRTGFGTVAKHEAIRSSLQSELERISQFSREDGLSKDRIIFYHRILNIRGERFNVISRVKDAGADYTGRTNHLAHHIVFTEAETERCYRTTGSTPLDFIKWANAADLWRDRWNESSRLFTAAEELNASSTPPCIQLPAKEWREVTGAAGNAAILAPGGAASGGCWILYKQDQSSKILDLIGESVRLNSTPWNVSFSTNTQPTDRIEEILWRGVTSGSPLERAARQSVRPVIDLTGVTTLPPPVEAFVNQAETGLLKAAAPKSNHKSILGKAQSSQQLAVENHARVTPLVSDAPKGTSMSHLLKKGNKSKSLSKGSSKWFSPLLLVLTVTIALVGVAAFVICSQMLVKETDFNELVTHTQEITDKITDYHKRLLPEGSTSDDWGDQISQTLRLYQYRVGGLGFKGEFNEADNMISSLKKEEYKQLCESIQAYNINDKTLVSNLLAQVKKVKSEYDKAKKIEDEKVEQAINAQEATQQAATQKAIEEAKSRANEAKKMLIEKPSPTPQKITIEFKTINQNGSDDRESLFKLKNYSSSYTTVVDETNPLIGFSKITSDASTTNWKIGSSLQLNIQDFKKNPPPIFATKDTNNQIAITFISTNNPLSVEIANGPFYATNENGVWKLKISAEKGLNDFLAAASNSGCVISNAIEPELPKIQNKEIPFTTLAGTGDFMNQRIKELDKKIKDIEEVKITPLALGTPPPDSQDVAAVKTILFGANTNLFSGLTPLNTNDAALIPSFDQWAKQQNQSTTSEKSYRDYLKVILENYKYYEKAQSTLTDGFQNLATGPALQMELKECFKSLFNDATDFNNKFKQADSAYRNQHAEEGIYITNLLNLFSFDNTKQLDKIFPPPPPPPPDPAASQKLEKKKIIDFMKDLQAGSFKKYKPRIELRTGTNAVLIFKTPSHDDL